MFDHVQKHMMEKVRNAVWFGLCADGSTGDPRRDVECSRCRRLHASHLVCGQKMYACKVAPHKRESASFAMRWGCWEGCVEILRRGSRKMFDHIFEKLMKKEWEYGPVTCRRLYLHGVDIPIEETEKMSKSVIEVRQEELTIERTRGGRGS
eukprot:63086-Hanusia_phi.AAC.3